MRSISPKCETAATLEAYERWAPRYPAVPHNPLMRVEQDAMLEQWPDIAGRRALDLACGSGRYSRLLAQSRASDVVAVDFSEGMLRLVSDAHRVRASMMRLPFASGAFAAVICGLALGHAAQLREWILEIARVLEPGGTLLYSDFHPEAFRAGLTRSFKDEDGRTFTLPHRCHDVATQREAAAEAGLRVASVRELRVGYELRESFSGSEEFYARWHGLPLVLVVRACK
jgi:ubiquinone/menaquinone biosynthesis C-methylase UbiE